MNEDNLPPLEKTFLNQLVLELIFSFLTIDDILRIRRVNWFFKGVGDQIIQTRKCKVVFAKLFKFDFQDPNHIKMDDFINTLLCRNWHLPFNNYVMEMPYHMCDRVCVDIDTWFCRKISQTVKRLKFVSCVPSNFSNNWFWSIAEWYPCLESVVFDTCNDSWAPNFPAITNFGKLVQISLRLKSLALKLRDNADPSSLMHFLLGLQNGPAGRIKHLKLSAAFEDDHWNLLSCLKFRLTTFKVDILEKAEFGMESFKRFLISQSETLERLKITLELKKPLELAFPEMNKLVYLRVNFIPKDCKTQFPGLCYATQFPNLKRLLLQGKYKQNIDLNLTHQTNRSMSVEYLQLPPYSDVATALKIFPNVRDLRCSSIDMNTLDVLRSINYLQRLTLYGHGSSDSDSALESFVNGQVGRKRFPQAEKFGENLKYLKFVQIKMTDKETKFILGKLKSLKYLDLWECDKAKISYSYLEELRKKLKVYINSGCIKYW